MIIISEKIDAFLTRVEQWISFKKRDCYRINAEEPVRGINLNIKDGDCEIGILREEDLKQIQLTNHRIWHRRGLISFIMPTESKDIDDKFLPFLSREAKALFNGILLILDTKGLLVGRHVEDKGNKLYHLFIASINGLNVPNTFVTSSKEQLLQTYSSNPSLVTKPISDSFYGTMYGKNLVGFVNKIDKYTIDYLPNSFFPMLFQEDVERAYEVRSFFYCGEVFSMATIIYEGDNRIKDIKEVSEKDKRYVPFELPEGIKEKMIKMMREIDLDTASFDFVMDKNGKLYFLELNQYGQLNEMSYHCNYSVEEFVSNHLMGNG